MAEKPILFSTPMVQALMREKDPKTMTRRVCKQLEGHEFEWGLDRPPYLGNYKYFGRIEPRKFGWITLENQWLYDLQTKVDESKTYLLKAPYQVGDILWVRETWARLNDDYHPDDKGSIYVYKADHITGNDGPDLLKWRPSIHMPKEAARLRLTVKDVRVERLQDITEDDALKEGCLPAFLDGAVVISAKGKFHALWDSISGKKHPWESNPYVWVISFERRENHG